jgi:hypothetical protein
MFNYQRVPGWGAPINFQMISPANWGIPQSLWGVKHVLATLELILKRPCLFQRGRVHVAVFLHTERAHGWCLQWLDRMVSSASCSKRCSLIGCNLQFREIYIYISIDTRIATRIEILLYYYSIFIYYTDYGSNYNTICRLDQIHVDGAAEFSSQVLSDGHLTWCGNGGRSDWSDWPAKEFGWLLDG